MGTIICEKKKIKAQKAKALAADSTSPEPAPPETLVPAPPDSNSFIPPTSLQPNGRLRCWLNAPLSSILFHKHIRENLNKNPNNIFSKFINGLNIWDEKLYKEFMVKHQATLLDKYYGDFEKRAFLTMRDPPMGDAGATLLFLQDRLEEENIDIYWEGKSYPSESGENLGYDVINNPDLISIVVGTNCVDATMSSGVVNVGHFISYIKLENWYYVDALDKFVPKQRSVEDVLRDINRCKSNTKKFVFLVYKGMQPVVNDIADRDRLTELFNKIDESKVPKIEAILSKRPYQKQRDKMWEFFKWRYPDYFPKAQPQTKVNNELQMFLPKAQAQTKVNYRQTNISQSESSDSYTEKLKNDIVMLEEAIEDNPNNPTLLTLQKELLKKRNEYIVILKSKLQEDKYVSADQVLTRVIPYLIPDLEELQKIPFYDMYNISKKNGIVRIQNYNRYIRPNIKMLNLIKNIYYTNRNARSLMKDAYGKETLNYISMLPYYLHNLIINDIGCVGVERCATNGEYLVDCSGLDLQGSIFDLGAINTGMVRAGSGDFSFAFANLKKCIFKNLNIRGFGIYFEAANLDNTDLTGISIIDNQFYFDEANISESTRFPPGFLTVEERLRLINFSNVPSNEIFIRLLKTNEIIKVKSSNREGIKLNNGNFLFHNRKYKTWEVYHKPTGLTPVSDEHMTLAPGIDDKLLKSDNVRSNTTTTLLGSESELELLIKSVRELDRELTQKQRMNKGEEVTARILEYLLDQDIPSEVWQIPKTDGWRRIISYNRYLRVNMKNINLILNIASTSKNLFDIISSGLLKNIINIPYYLRGISFTDSNPDEIEQELATEELTPHIWRFCDFQGSNFTTTANLGNADFTGSNLKNVTFDKHAFGEVKFYYTNLENSKFIRGGGGYEYYSVREPDGEERWQIEKGRPVCLITTLRNSNCKNLIANREFFESMTNIASQQQNFGSLTNKYFGKNVLYCDFSDAVFRHTNWHRWRMGGLTLYRCNFENTILENLTTAGLNFYECKFKDIIWRDNGINLSEIHNCYFLGGNISNIGLNGYIDNNSFIGTNLDNVKLTGELSYMLFMKCRINNLKIFWTRDEEHYPEESSFTNVQFVDCVISNTDFPGSQERLINYYDVRFVGSTFDNVNFIAENEYYINRELFDDAGVAFDDYDY